MARQKRKLTAEQKAKKARLRQDPSGDKGIGGEILHWRDLASENMHAVAASRTAFSKEGAG
jgi:hypothetical protein